MNGVEEEGRNERSSSVRFIEVFLKKGKPVVKKSC